MIEKKELLAKGKRGLVYYGEHNGKKVVIKEKNPNSTAEGTLENEYNFLRKLNKENIGPIVYELKNNKLVMEKITGELIIDYLRNNSKKETVKVIMKIFNQLKRMDELGINKEELTNPYKHIIVHSGNPVMIDFERCRYTEKPQNVTQFCSFLTSKRLLEIFKNKELKINKEKLNYLAKKYKEEYNTDSYKELIGELG